MKANQVFKILLFLIIYSSIASAADPTISFIYPTTDNNSINTTQTININTTHTDADGDNTTAWLDYGLVGCWHMNEVAGGTNVEDCSRYKNNGTWSGNTTSNVTTGKFGNGLDFDGTNDYVDINNKTGNFTFEDFTISFWLNSRSNPTIGGHVFLVKGKSSANGWYVQNEPLSGKYLKFVTSQTGVVQETSVDGDHLPLNKFNHILITRSGATAKIYINLTDYTNTTQNHINPLPSADSLRIGTYLETPADFAVNGSIDEVFLWNRVLSDNEIKAVYNASAYRLNTTISNLNFGTSINYTAYIQDVYGNISSTETRFVNIRRTDQADYVASTCTSTISWWTIGISMSVIVIIAFGGMLAMGFITGKIPFDSDKLVDFAGTIILFMVFGMIGLGIAIQILNIVGCS